MPLLAGLVAALLAAAPAPASPGSAPRSAESIQARANEILARGDLQTTLPHAWKPVELPDLLARLLVVLLYAGLALLAALAGTWLFRALRAGTRDPEVEGAPGAGAGPEPIPIPSAEAAAAAGRYGEAIHALLLDTLAALSRAARLAPSLTSREIVGRVRLAAPAREALAGLVAAVELSHFGGAAPGEADYRACLDRFHVFLESYRGTT
ncbi:DUF4129 domain-containing protein [Anaeromyxobacter terrae]|uniref:DUF4129 domain-containing protein n=1 Tax=Anaeromyxobacter terrae TaxID=2925406 RepID=UPI001F5A03CF|nr:DUF4129 domain-containing protein [Anaeromyxobacter sp. SG22]